MGMMLMTKADGSCCCEEGIICEEFEPYHLLTGDVDYSVGVIIAPGDDACCEGIFVGVTGGQATWEWDGLNASGRYQDGPKAEPCSGIAWGDVVDFFCDGDGTFELSIVISLGVFTWQWGAQFPEPFQFGVPYTLPFDVTSAGDTGSCAYTAYTYGDATVTFYEPT